MNQGQLVIAFALEWPVYFILYLGVGLLSIVELIFFSLYHYIFNRKRPRPSFKFLAYIKAIFPAAINGTILASIPVAFILLLITFVMAGKLFTIDLTYAC